MTYGGDTVTCGVHPDSDQSFSISSDCTLLTAPSRDLDGADGRYSDTHRLRINATDGSGLVGVGFVDVTINNINDGKPRFGAGTYDVTVDGALSAVLILFVRFCDGSDSGLIIDAKSLQRPLNLEVTFRDFLLGSRWFAVRKHHQRA